MNEQLQRKIYASYTKKEIEKMVDLKVKERTKHHTDELVSLGRDYAAQYANRTRGSLEKFVNDSYMYKIMDPSNMRGTPYDFIPYEEVGSIEKYLNRKGFISANRTGLNEFKEILKEKSNLESVADLPPGNSILFTNSDNTSNLTVKRAFNIVNTELHPIYKEVPNLSREFRVISETNPKLFSRLLGYISELQS